MPFQADLANEVGYGAVLGFGGAGPREVSEEVGGFPLEGAEVVFGCGESTTV